MLSFALVAALAGDLSGFGAAPRDTVEPTQAVSLIVRVFANCQVTAVQKMALTAPSGVVHRSTKTLRAAACDGAVLLLTKDEVDTTLDDGSNARYTNYFEDRWERDAPRWQIELTVAEPNDWPVKAEIPSAVTVNNILLYPPGPMDERLIWGEIPIAFFVADPAAGTTLADLVTEGGRCGYVLDEVVWTSEDRASQVRYSYSSPTFGRTAVTFSKTLGKWLPTAVTVDKSADDKLYLAGATALVVKNGVLFDGFTNPVYGVDRQLTRLEITYSGITPASIVFSDSHFMRDAVSVQTVALDISDLATGGVTRDDVERSGIPIPDGTDVVQFSDEFRNLKFTTKDGQIVRDIDIDGVAVGATASFSSSRRSLAVLNIVVVAAAGAFVLYRYSRRHRRE